MQYEFKNQELAEIKERIGTSLREYDITTMRDRQKYHRRLEMYTRFCKLMEQSDDELRTGLNEAENGTYVNGSGYMSSLRTNPSATRSSIIQSLARNIRNIVIINAEPSDNNTSNDNIRMLENGIYHLAEVAYELNEQLNTPYCNQTRSDLEHELLGILGVIQSKPQIDNRTKFQKIRDILKGNE